MLQNFATKMVQYYITPYEDGYCFVHDSGRPSKFIFSNEKASNVKCGQAKLERVDQNYFALIYTNGKVERIPFVNIQPEAIVGTKYRMIGVLGKHHISTPTN